MLRAWFNFAKATKESSAELMAALDDAAEKLK